MLAMRSEWTCFRVFIGDCLVESCLIQTLQAEILLPVEAVACCGVVTTKYPAVFKWCWYATPVFFLSFCKELSSKGSKGP